MSEDKQLECWNNQQNEKKLQGLEDTGVFDSSRHTVVETKPAPEPSKVNDIAEVFRPGYVYKGEVLRGQEIIIYV